MREQGEYVCGIDLDGCLNDEENIEDDMIREIIYVFNNIVRCHWWAWGTLCSRSSEDGEEN